MTPHKTSDDKMGDDKTGDDAETIVIEYHLAEPPGKVWRALTQPELLAAWLAPNDIRAEVGHRFQVAASTKQGAGDAVQCEVLSVEPHRELSYSWREVGDGGAVDSRVTWTLTPTLVGGTHLRLVHDGFVQRPARTLAMAGADLGAAMAAGIHFKTTSTWRSPRLISPIGVFRRAA